MTRLAAFGRWLATPVREVRRLFPFTQEGRQTLVYIIFAGAGPTLTALVMWAMHLSISLGWQAAFMFLARTLGWSLLIIVSALGCFVSIRAIRLGKDGFGVEGRDQPSTVETKTTTTTETDTKVIPPPAG